MHHLDVVGGIEDLIAQGAAGQGLGVGQRQQEDELHPAAALQHGVVVDRIESQLVIPQAQLGVVAVGHQVVVDLAAQLVEGGLETAFATGLSQLLQYHQAVEGVHQPGLVKAGEPALVIHHQAHAQVDPAVGVGLGQAAGGQAEQGRGGEAKVSSQIIEHGVSRVYSVVSSGVVASRE